MAKSASRNSGRKSGSSVMAGVLIGLAIAAALAVGVALWVTGNSPFKSAAPTPAAVTAPIAPATPEPAPSFDFYKVLPGDAPAELPAAPAAPAVRYYLQAGAFQNPADADNLKAQLALLGVEAAIQTTDVPGKGIFHRVRIGPFPDMSGVERTRELLAQNNLPATLVKETPTH